MRRYSCPVRGSTATGGWGCPSRDCNWSPVSSITAFLLTRASYPSVTPRSIHRRTLAHQHVCGRQRLQRAGVGPVPLQHTVAEAPLLQVARIDRRDLQLAAFARLECLDDVEHV